MQMRDLFFRRCLWFFLLALGLAACSQTHPVEVVYGNHSRQQKDAGTVVVQQGDSLSRIAVRHGVDLAALVGANDVKPPFTIFPGQKLRLPPKTDHVVLRGETLPRIAARYGTTLQALARLNRLSPQARLAPGQRVRLPDLSRTDKRSSGAGQLSGSNGAGVGSAGSEGPESRHVTRAPIRFQWPVRGKIVSRYGRVGTGHFNDGINIVARRGTPVRAVDDGIVAYAGSELTTLGNLLLVKHGDGWISTYAHNDRILVEAGQSVKRGQIVAQVGSSGQVSSPQLHFQLRRGIRTVDPERYLNAG